MLFATSSTIFADRHGNSLWYKKTRIVVFVEGYMAISVVNRIKCSYRARIGNTVPVDLVQAQSVARWNPRIQQSVGMRHCILLELKNREVANTARGSIYLLLVARHSCANVMFPEPECKER